MQRNPKDTNRAFDCLVIQTRGNGQVPDILVLPSPININATKSYSKVWCSVPCFLYLD
jgi:hypothetical protein